MALEPENFAPTPNVTNFQRHVARFQQFSGLTVTHADEDANTIAIVFDDADDSSLHEQVEQVAKDRFFNVTSGYRDDVGAFVMVLEDMPQ